MMEILKVSAKSNPNSVAGALAGVLREKGGAEVQAIGAGALNQAIKATAIARGFVAPSGIDLVCVPAFTDIEIEGVLMTMFSSRTNLAIQVVDEVKKFFPQKVYKTIIPRNVRLSEAPSFGKPVYYYDKSSKGSVAYDDFAKEFLKKNNKRPKG